MQKQNGGMPQVGALKATRTKTIYCYTGKNLQERKPLKICREKFTTLVEAIHTSPSQSQHTGLLQLTTKLLRTCAAAIAPHQRVTHTWKDKMSSSMRCWHYISAPKWPSTDTSFLRLKELHRACHVRWPVQGPKHRVFSLADSPAPNRASERNQETDA